MVLCKTMPGRYSSELKVDKVLSEKKNYFAVDHAKF